VICFAVTGLAGCSDSTPAAPPREPIDKQTDAFSSFAIERVIPLRIVMMANDCAAPETDWNCTWRTPPSQTTCTSCTSGSNCGPDTADFAEIRGSLEQANFALKSLGVQFYISRIEKYKMPHFWNTRPNSPAVLVQWDQVRDELRLVYPTLALTEFPADRVATEHDWLQAVAIRAGDPREVIVWVAECSSGWDGARPWLGAASLMADREQFWYARGLAHELGHIMGLEHTMYPKSSSDPELQSDNVGTSFAEYWDLYFGPPAPNTYFSTRAAANAYQGNVLVKHNWEPGGQNQNCWLDTNCTLSCNIGGVLETIGTPGIAGLGFTFAGDNPGAGVYRRGANAMMYIGDPDVTHQCQWSGFSESQSEQVKKILRSDVRIDAPAFFAPKTDGYTAKRNLIGDLRNRWGFDQLDFDGDGKRDLAVWQPPGTPGAPTPGVGRLRVLKSSSGYTQIMEKDFGLLGDVPVPGFYDSDNATDFAVLRRGGPAADNPFDHYLRWYWCKSAANPQNHDCVDYGYVQWGWQYDVPLPNVEFDGNANTRDIAVYRPTDKYIYWKALGGGSGSIYAGFSNRVVHMHGLYDNDTKTDIVLYDPGVAQPLPSPGPRFQIRLSSQNWSTATIRTFDLVLMADAIAASGAGSNAPAVRHGGVAIPVENNGRRALRVWDAYTGNFHTMWDPTTSSTIKTCQWGSPRDVPLGGPIDRNGDNQTDFAVFAPNGAAPSIRVKNTGRICVPGSGEYSFSLPGATSRSHVMAVRDLNGDGRGDFIVVDPDAYSWSLWHSQANGTFILNGIHYLGDIGGVIL
jgi:hypothetical protein